MTVALRPGVIGLGMIGSAVATSLADHGQIPVVYDVRDGVADDLDGVPAQVDSPREVTQRSDVVMVAVVSADQAEQVLVGADGVLTEDRPGLIVVLLSTVSLEAVQHLAGLCSDRGAVLLDAGVTSGGGQAADSGLVLMVGGPDDDLTRAMPVLEGFARSVIRCGPTGTGMVAKLARNAAQYGRWAVMAEAAAFAAAGGVAPETFLRVLEEGANGRDESLVWLRAHDAGFAMTAEQQAQFEAIADKDLAAVQESAAELGVETAMANLTRPRVGPAMRKTAEREVLPDNDFDRGVTIMEKVVGGRIGGLVRQAPRLPVLTATVGHLFADIWSRTALTLRDRRLLAVGVTAMLGRADLLTNHLAGAYRAGDVTVDQLREISLFLHYYAGWGNGTAVDSVVEAILADEQGTG